MIEKSWWISYTYNIITQNTIFFPKIYWYSYFPFSHSKQTIRKAQHSHKFSAMIITH